MAEILTKQRDELKKTTLAKYFILFNPITRESELERVKKTINNIQGPVSTMISKFKGSSISLSVAEDKIYDETTTFNEQNINEYLAEVEEYIKCLLALMAKQFGYEHPILIALGLDDLPSKATDTQSIPKELLNDSEDDEEPDDGTLADMLDKTKFDTMMGVLLEGRKEKSNSMMLESQLESVPHEESNTLK